MERINDGGGVPRRAARYALCRLSLGVCLAGIPVAADAELWPGYGNSSARTGNAIRFVNGAVGTMTVSPSGQTIHFYDPSTRTGSTLIAPNYDDIVPSPSKARKLLSSAARVGNPLGAFITAAIDPSDLGDSSSCGALSGANASAACQRGYDSCDHRQQGGANYVNPFQDTCLTKTNSFTAPPGENDATVTLWELGRYGSPSVPNAQYLTAQEFFDIVDYPNPDTNNRHWKRFYRTDWAAILDLPIPGVEPHECFETIDIICPDVPDTLAVPDIEGFPELHGENRFLSDVWEPLPMPPGLENATAEDMNPGGAVTGDLTLNPSAVDDLTPWEVAGSGTTTGTVGDQDVNIEIDLPDPCGAPGQPACSVTVDNFPTWEGSIPDAPDLVEESFTLPTASPGAKWLPSACPGTKVIPFGASSIDVDLTAFCTGLGWLGIAINLLGALSCGFIVVRS